jgi:hypothetical protein
MSAESQLILIILNKLLNSLILNAVDVYSIKSAPSASLNNIEATQDGEMEC